MLKIITHNCNIKIRCLLKGVLNNMLKKRTKKTPFLAHFKVKIVHQNNPSVFICNISKDLLYLKCMGSKES